MKRKGKLASFIDRFGQVRKKPTETDEEYRARSQQFGQLYATYGLQLVSLPQYQSAGDDIRRKAFAALNEGVKKLIGEGKEAAAPGRLNPYAVISSGRESLRREQSKRERKQRRGR